jgi:hypothetical protein
MAATMKEYEVLGPTGMEITVKLSDEDAAKAGLKASDAVKRPVKSKQAAPQNKQAQPSDKRVEAASKSFGG